MSMGVHGCSEDASGDRSELVRDEDHGFGAITDSRISCGRCLVAKERKQAFRLEEGALIIAKEWVRQVAFHRCWERKEGWRI